MYTSFLFDSLCTNAQLSTSVHGREIDVTKRFHAEFPNRLPKGLSITFQLAVDNRNIYWKIQNKERGVAHIYCNQISNFCGGIFLHSMGWSDSDLAGPLMHCVLSYIFAEGYSCVSYISTANQEKTNDVLKNLEFQNTFNQVSKRTKANIHYWNHDLIEYFKKMKYDKDFYGKEAEDTENF